MSEDDIPQEEVISLKRRGTRRGRTESIIDNVVKTYHPTMHLHICTRSRCKKGGYGYKFCGPQFTGDLSPYEQARVDHRVQMEEGRGKKNFDSIKAGLEMLIQETDVFRFETHRGEIIERFCAVPPCEIGQGIVHQTCEDCLKEESEKL